MIKKLALIFPLIAFFLSLTLATPITAHAQAQPWSGCTQSVSTPNGTEQIASLKCLPIVFSNVVTAALEFVGAVAVILLVYAGIRFVTSGGDPKQVAAARQIITYAIIGLVIVLCSFGIIMFISYITGAKCITTLSFTSCQ